MRWPSVFTPRVLAWAVPLLALTTGTILASVNTVAIWAPRGSESAGVETFAVESFALWPAGLVLIGAGVVTLTATALVETVRVEGVPRRAPSG